MKEMEEEIVKAKQIVNESFVFDRNPKILELSKFTPYWTTYINGETMPFVKAVVWEDEEENNWKVKVPSRKMGTFELNGKALKQDSNMESVHSSGHFAIAKDDLTLRKDLSRQI